MNLEAISQTVAKFSPLLGSIIATANPMAGVLVGSIASLFNANPTSSDDIIDKIKSDPKAAAKIKKMELAHEKELQEVNIRIYQAQLQDLQNAREIYLEKIKYLGKDDWVVKFLVVSLVFMVFLGGIGAYFAGKDIGQPFLMMLTFLIGSMSTVLAFYFSGIDPKKIMSGMINNE